MTRYTKIFLAFLLFLPAVASAQLNGVKDLIKAFGGLLNPLIGVTVALALLGFFWGLVLFIFHVGGDEKAVNQGKRIMGWGLVALFVIVSVWGIVGFMQNAVLPGGSSTSPTPLFPD
ncbi:MAG: hypothetical protein CO183_01235 [Candidatus Zambryskibacteria bacterium CG_4_9_14_3_um_filter_42_9]|uniref:Conjugal transfer protein TrbC n=1 Tax=Candidatus Zambryskibacteria bacterium CG22_combo_CG10-13_8_21_14_all_42_17 TaxID=1975118 RepID=A0A2H0BE43_9BACT|nr:MAG: hypothetical protein COX06_00490 [Candidatus Zambryskibacteria bacterium CG22_combo_CG10-13_8_21_14_all_42_17]PJA36873.1 MAG: hypothetical protein CO183_01235 [Candidatus Zambryskibacteria bacterium CG_4_9_14_3_um_filter_42_9]